MPLFGQSAWKAKDFASFQNTKKQTETRDQSKNIQLILKLCPDHRTDLYGFCLRTKIFVLFKHTKM